MTKNEHVFLSRVTLALLLILFAILWAGWGVLLATAIVYPVAGLVSFFIHISKFNITTWCFAKWAFLVIFLFFGIGALIYSLFSRKDYTLIKPE